MFDPAADVQAAAGRAATPAFVDRGYTGDQPAAAARARGITPEVVRPPEAEEGFAPPPRRWAVGRSLGWLARSRRRARADERTAARAGWHWVASTGLMLTRVMERARDPLDPGS